MLKPKYRPLDLQVTISRVLLRVLVNIQMRGAKHKCVSVSYTHLDVYKRQLYLFCAVTPLLFAENGTAKSESVFRIYDTATETVLSLIHI